MTLRLVMLAERCQPEMVTAKAIVALFGLHATASIWLKDMTDTYVFPDENGLFPVLDPFATYHVEVGPSRDQESTYIHTYIFDEAGQSLGTQRAGVDLP